MKWIALLTLVACQRGNGAEKVSSEYRQDITTLCDVMHLSGADEKPAEERQLAIAMWLAPHIKTEQAHEFLVSIQPLVGEPKAKALEAEATRVGLSDCALAAQWR